MESDAVPGYTTLTTPEGETYYVNNETGESRWERPPPAHPRKPIEGPPTQAPTPTLTGSTGPVWGGPDPDSRGDGVDLTIAKGAVVAIVISMVLPYVSVFGFGVTGIDMIGYMGEVLGDLDGISEELAGGDSDSCPYANDGECDEPWLCESGTDGSDCGAANSASDSIPLRGYMLLFGGLMFLFSPIVFLLTALLGGISVFSNGTLPKLIGKIHLGFFGIMMLLLVIGGSLLGDLIGEIGFSVFSFVGIGFWIGGLSGIGFIYEKS